jgi:hypothetical protein
MTKARNPKTGKFEYVVMLDNYYGNRTYGVKFADAQVLPENKVELIREE